MKTYLLLLSLFIGVALSNPQNNIHDRPLYDDLKNIMPFEPVHYSQANVSRAYKVTTKFNPKGMGHLYLVTNLFMDYLQKGDPLPKGFLRVEQGQIKMSDIKTEWPSLAKHYAGTIILAVVALLFGLMMPCAGFLMCCCRCAGNCGARSHAYDKRHDPCKRVSLGMLLSVFAIIILFGVVCAFVTNQYLEEGVQELPTNVRTGLGDTQLYLANTKEEVNNLLVTNYRELQSVLNDILEASGQIVKDKLAEVSKAVALNNLTAIVSGLGRIKEDLSDINQVTRHLQGNASRLNNALQLVRDRLLKQLRDCEEPCKEVLNKYNIDGLSVQSDFNKLPNVSSSLRNVSLLIDTNIEREVLKGKKSFDDIQLRIQSSVNQTIPLIKSAIQKAGQACEKTANEIISVLDKVNQRIPEHVTGRVKQGENLIQQYSIYRYYADTTTSTLLLVILACLTFGLFYGFCGKRVDGMYGGDDYCCNKGTGGRYLMVGVYLMFLFSVGLAAVAVAHMLLGVLAEKAMCEPLYKPTSDSQLMNLADDLVNLDYIYPQGSTSGITLSQLIRSCHQNESMYEVLGLEAVVNVSQVAEFKVKYGIAEQMEDFQRQIRLNSKVVILTDEARNQLSSLASSPLSDIDFTAYNDLVENQITSIDLNKLANVLRDTSNKLPTEYVEVVYYLKNEAMFLESSQREIVDVMAQLSRQLRANTTALQEDLKFNHTSLRDAVHGLIREVEDAQEYLSVQGPDEVIKLAELFVDEFTGHIDDYLARVVRLTKTSIGKCWPISNVYNATLVSVCSKVINPFNGFWVSICWSLALFIPCIIVCTMLSSLYNKADTYHGPLVDSEYLYDAYADRDNIPLANSSATAVQKPSRGSRGLTPGLPLHSLHDKKNGGSGGGGGHHRSHGQNYHESYDNQSGYVGDYNASGGGGSSQPLSGGRGNVRRPVSGDGSRFRDAAPKHWDFPSGGPPHYRNPPPATEYERPPPYYYPGPGVSLASARAPGPPPMTHRRPEVTGSGRSSTSSSSSGTNGPPAVFTYQKLEALESRLYHGGAALVPASTWRRHNRLNPSRPSPRP